MMMSCRGSHHNILIDIILQKFFFLKILNPNGYASLLFPFFFVLDDVLKYLVHFMDILQIHNFEFDIFLI